jgi:intein/homing endonuclease
MSRYTPRPLTEQEIEDIISGIEKMTYVVKSATQTAQDEVKNLLRKQLSSIELVPEAIPEMKKIIRNQYNRAVIEPQTPVGLLVSEALSQPITQMTLNSVIGETEIVIADQETKEAEVVQIGEWIDGLLKENKDKIVNIPENRTEYLELEKPVLIPSTTCDGRSEWMELTAVTRHLPVGDLIKIKTRSGREVTATSQKSFLIYDEKEDKLKEKDGKDLVAGDYVGVHLKLENDDITYEHVETLESYLFELIRGNKFVGIYHGGTKYPIRVLRDMDKDEHFKKWRDIVLDPIVSLESIPSQDRNVYDVTVPKSLNFNLFNGLIMAD